jgi:hypothetical protein
MRCPWCHASQTVPQESRGELKAEEYALRAAETEDAGQSDAPPETYVPVVCGLCHTRMYATPAQVGQSLICPDCGTSTVVRPAPPTRMPAPQNPNSAPAAEIYNVLEGTDQPPPTDKTAFGKYIPVICATCRTRMLATQEQVGQDLVCPDCGLTTRVPAPAEAIDLDRPDVTKAGQYGLGGVDQPGPGSVALREHFRYVCPVCSTHLQATRDEAGHQTRCPDCFTTFTIPQPPVKSPAARGEDEAVESYVTSGAAFETPPVLVSGFAPVVRGEPLRRLAEDEDAGRRESFLFRAPRDELPPWPLVKGVFTFPWYRHTWPRWVGLTLCGTAVALVGVRAASLIAASDYFNLVGWVMAIMGVCLATLAAAIGFIWLMLTANACLTTVSDTASGIDTLEDWHQAEWLDRLPDVFFLINSFAWAGAVGLGLDAALRACGLPAWTGIWAALLLVHPIVLLSMLETASFVTPVSGLVLESIFTAWWGWLQCYFLSALLHAAAILTTVGLFHLASLRAVYLLPLVIVTWYLIYFRLLGRLGLYCAHRVAQRQRQERLREL